MLRSFIERIDDPIGRIERSFDPAAIRISLAGYELSIESRQEVKRILSSRRRAFDIRLGQSRLSEYQSWSITSAGSIVGEVVAVPPATSWSALPTSTEVRLVQAADRLSESEFEDVTSLGGTILFSQSGHDLGSIHRLIAEASPRAGAPTVLFSYSNLEIVVSRFELSGSKKALPIFCTASSTEPLKYHFLEVYRSIEIQFLYEIFSEIEVGFFKKPKPTIDKAKSDLAAELNQIMKLSRHSPVYFENVCDAIMNARDSGNSFAIAIKEKHDENKNPGASRSEHGAVFIYYIRCAIVHAGEKDLIFESYHDADDVISAILLPTEMAALAICGLSFI